MIQINTATITSGNTYTVGLGNILKIHAISADVTITKQGENSSTYYNVGDNSVVKNGTYKTLTDTNQGEIYKVTGGSAYIVEFSVGG